MKLSTKGKYGLYAMYYLAEHEGEGPQSLKSMADIGVPEDYLEQLLACLRRAGLVNAYRGAQGGYSLALPPEQITVGAIMDATEGPLNFSSCISDEGCCEKSAGCKTRKVWGYVSDSINQLLQSITLRHMLEHENFGDGLNQTKE